MRPTQHGSTNQSVVVRILDSTTFLPETGVAYNASGIAFWYRREGGAKTTITLASLTALTDAHSDGGWYEIGDGYYRLDVPDAAFASGATGVQIGGTVTDMIVISPYLPLVAYDPQTAAVGANTTTPLDGSGTRSALGLAAANLDTQLGALATASVLNTVDANVDSILVNTGTSIPAQITALNDIAAADVLAAGDVDGYTLEETLKLCLAALAGKLSGGGSETITIRAADDSKARITATVDSNGNRSAVTLDETG